MALQDYTFADGLTVPEGAYLSINGFSRHSAPESSYANPRIFDGFRFAREGGEDQLLSTAPTTDFHSFGHGKTTWYEMQDFRLTMSAPLSDFNSSPGRFFATAEIKLMLAHLLIYYDLKLDGDTYPKKILLEASALPNREASVS